MTGPALRATARLQFHPGFTLDDAVKVVPYLAKLGISHLYASPILRARSGSTHGYDVVDYGQVNPELGGEAAYLRLCDALAEHGLGLIVDFVPNHMGIGPENAWWTDVLAHGRASRFAGFFDIDWESPANDGRLFLPYLGKPYPEALLAGDVGLVLKSGGSRLHIDCHGQLLPASAASMGLLLDRAALASDQGTAQILEALAGRFDALADERRDAPLLDEFSRLLADNIAARSAVEEVVNHLAPGQARSVEHAALLDPFLQLQHYRLAYWRTAPHEINYRRFFEINELAAIKVEDEEVFTAVHAWLLAQVREGRVQGVRLDHIDGLLDPTGYLVRLRRQLTAAGAAPDFPILVEKILAPHEELLAEWPVQGTTGYESMDAIQSILIDRRGEAPITEAFEAFTGLSPDIEEAIWTARREILEGSFAGSLQQLVELLARLSRREWRHRDITQASLREALVALVQAFTVYRTYMAPDGSGSRDGLKPAFRAAQRTLPQQHLRALEFLEAALGGQFEPGRQQDVGAPPEEHVVVREARQALLRFQHLTSPVAAKAVEDTAFYRVFPLASLNEVGGAPERFGMDLGTFNDFAGAQQDRQPMGLVALATHDHKRGPDVRARLSILSELGVEWGELLGRLAQAGTSWRGAETEREAPSRAHEYLAYQTLIGMRSLTGDDQAELADRLWAYMQKAAREGKVETSWTEPDEAYERALESFVRGIAEAGPDTDFGRELAQVFEPLARGGAVKSLSQVTVQMTMPGVPDLYQGADRFDFSLVDPDNRRPVDWEERARALAGFELTPDPAFFEQWQDGRLKQWLTWRLLQARREEPELFARGRYVPLEIEGGPADEETGLLAFGRVHDGRRLCTIVPRFVAGRLSEDGGLGLAGLEGYTLAIPPGNRAIDILTGQEIEGNVVDIAPLLVRMPVAVLLMPPR